MRFHGKIHKGEFSKRHEDLANVVCSEVVVKVANVKTMVRDLGVSVSVLVHRDSKTRDGSTHGR